MIRSFFIQNKLYIIGVIVLVVCASFFSYYSTSTDIINTNLRVRKMKEIQYKNVDENTHVETMVNSQDFISNQDTDEKQLLLIDKKMLTVYFLLTVILSFYQFIQYIRSWIIQVSQSTTKLFMVHYLHLKDGKKNALSF